MGEPSQDFGLRSMVGAPACPRREFGGNQRFWCAARMPVSVGEVFTSKFISALSAQTSKAFTSDPQRRRC
jgi:hypothetical protein